MWGMSTNVFQSKMGGVTDLKLLMMEIQISFGGIGHYGTERVWNGEIFELVKGGWERGDLLKEKVVVMDGRKS